MTEEIRKPAVAGRFYPESRTDLKNTLSDLCPSSEKKTKAIAAVSPHAGYVYSGGCAGKVFAAIEIPEHIVVLSPNHTDRLNRHAPCATTPHRSWETPLGEIPIDRTFLDRLVNHYSDLQEDAAAHRLEHSTEVQLPFIQHFREHFFLSPLTLKLLSFAECKRLGEALAKAITEAKGDTLIIASSDMTHYESATHAQQKDTLAIDKMLALDPEGLYETVFRNQISMCGIIPATVALVAAKSLGGRSARLIEYTHSGIVTGDTDQVVGYAGLIFT